MVRYIDENYEDDGLTISQPPPAPLAYLILIVDGRPGHSIPLFHEAKMGRDKRNVVVTADQKVSRHHATLTPIDDTFMIQDQASANGTYVNDVLITQPTRLNDSDKIRLGDTAFIFTFDEALDFVPPALVENKPAPAFSKQLYATSSPNFSLPQNIPTWTIFGCMAIIIVALLFVIAILLGIFVGQGQAGAIFWLEYPLPIAYLT